MNQPDLAPFRERLETLQRTPEVAADLADPLWDQPRSPELPSMPPPSAPANPGARSTDLAATVYALRQRSHQAGAQAIGDETSPAPPSLPPEIDLHWQRLQQEALAINELAHKQAIALQNFKRSADRLQWSLRKHSASHGLRLEDFCQLQPTSVPQVTPNESGTLLLTPVEVDLYADERHASQTAEEIRAFSQGRTPPPGTAGLPLVGEILSSIGPLWHGLTYNLEGRSRLTPLHIIVWLGGGVIGRLAIELALAAVPGLWPWLVGVTVGAVVLALYRLLLTPRPDIAFVSRLFLVLVGLALGGHL